MARRSSKLPLGRDKRDPLAALLRKEKEAHQNLSRARATEAEARRKKRLAEDEGRVIRPARPLEVRLAAARAERDALPLGPGRDRAQVRVDGLKRRLGLS